jgi:recombination protein RecR
MIKNNSYSLIEQLEQAFCVLPGVGQKSASRMAYHLLQHNRDKGRDLADALSNALDKVSHCELCQTLTEQALCNLCLATNRNSAALCVVANPLDVKMIEQSGSFNGRYFVLKGLLSPIDGIGPNELFLDKLFQRVNDEPIKEVILALSPTVEGEATIHFITQKLKNQALTLTRLAYGIPVGGELEYLNANTIGQALSARALCD